MFEVALPARHPKRLLEATEEFQGDSRVPFAEYNPQKRIRNISSPSGRCGGPHVNNQLAYSIGSSTILALKALFPQMNDKVRFHHHLIYAIAVSGSSQFYSSKK